MLLDFKHTTAAKRKVSLAHAGLKYPNRKRRSDEDICHNIEILRKANIGNKYTAGRVPWNKGLTNTYSHPMKGKQQPKMQKEKHPMWKGGISSLEYKEKAVGRKRPDMCEACGLTTKENKREMCCDHNHNTKKFRGWLCHHCNLVLGHVKDDSTILIKLTTYLQKYN